jgi:outer membrane immunogenic protein
MRYLAVAAVLLIPFSAQATDLPSRKSPPVVPVVEKSSGNWQGCFVGINGGGGHQANNWIDLGYNPNSDAGHDASNFAIVGAQAGCDVQSGNLILGANATLDWANLDTTHVYPNSYADHLMTTKVDSIALLAGRVGYEIHSDGLAYIKAGAALVNGSFVDNISSEGTTHYPGISDGSRRGWTIGAGYQRKLTQNVSFNIEYDYIELPNVTKVFVYSDSSTWRLKINQDIQLLKIGMNYNF